MTRTPDGPRSSGTDDRALGAGPAPSAAGAAVDPPAPSRSPFDRITLHGITGFGHHGVFDFEREQGQRFVVDVSCGLDLSAAGATDDLRQTVDYGALAASIHADIESEPVSLMESLAERVARTCLAQERVEEVEVTVAKPDAPMPVAVGSVAVTVRRRR